MRLISAAAHCPGAANRTPMRLATILLAAVGASGPAQSQYQPDSSISTGGARLPGPAGYQVGGGIDVGAPRRRAGGVNHHHHAGDGDQQRQLRRTDRPRGRPDPRADPEVELPPRGQRGCASTGLSRSTCSAMSSGVQVSSILPQANILANLEAIDNLFFVDASILVDQPVENPFLPSSQYLVDQQSLLRPRMRGWRRTSRATSDSM